LLLKISKKYTKTFNPRLTSMVNDGLHKSALSKAGLEDVCKKGLELYDKSKLNLGRRLVLLLHNLLESLVLK